MYKLRNDYLVVLAGITVYNLATLFIRNAVEGSTAYNYNFLLWNLFLAFVPLLLAALLLRFASKLNKVIILLWALLWLLFYPNAPYMISDLIHVQSNAPLVLYDTLIIFSFALLALFYGFYSLRMIHKVFRMKFGIKTAHTVLWLSIVGSSAGIYLGRILRLNSWDLFTHPIQVMETIIDHLFPVQKNPATYAIIFLFSVIQFIMLIMMKDMNEVDRQHLISHAPEAV